MARVYWAGGAIVMKHAPLILVIISLASVIYAVLAICEVL